MNVSKYNVLLPKYFQLCQIMYTLCMQKVIIGSLTKYDMIQVHVSHKCQVLFFSSTGFELRPGHVRKLPVTWS